MIYTKDHPVGRKRLAQAYLNSKLQEFYNVNPKVKGAIAMLPGIWDPRGAIDMYKKLPFVTKISAYENDSRNAPDVASGVFMSRLSDNKKPITFFLEDMVKGVTTETQLFTGIDYDSCTSIGNGSDILTLITKQHERMLRRKNPKPW
jgi:hypothetical protein